MRTTLLPPYVTGGTLCAGLDLWTVCFLFVWCLFMRIGDIKTHDVANGPGIRCSVFVTGCTHKCSGCFNAELQDRGAGREYDVRDEHLIMETLDKPYISGLTLLGGEPMQNVKGLIPLVRNVRERYGNSISIWCYSGYVFEHIQHIRGMKALCDMCDVLVDGKYVEELASPMLEWRGSRNQRIIDIPTTLQTHNIHLAYPSLFR